MRIWSLHPTYLDAKGLVALWRESLLAKNVLEGKTQGYKYHPQLIRFKTSKDPILAINFYLKFVWLEATKRNYNFDRKKFTETKDIEHINVTDGQLNFEKEHLFNKLKTRDIKKYKENVLLTNFDTHPLFKVIEGEIESWEKT